MELTQLNPKIERYLVETQKIIDHDPVIRKKLWVKLTFSLLGLLVMFGFYLWFEYLFKTTSDASFFILLIFFAGNVGRVQYCIFADVVAGLIFLWAWHERQNKSSNFANL